MCTAICTKGFCSRTLDMEMSFDERIIFVPGSTPITAPGSNASFGGYAIMGIGCIRNGFPLLYDGINEHGLWVGALKFPVFSKYAEKTSDRSQIPSYLFIPHLLSYAKTVNEAEEMLKHVTVNNAPFSEELPPSPLHWIISDGERALVYEACVDKATVYENPYGILTNSPPFEYHKNRVLDYSRLSNAQGSINPLDPQAENYGFGMGGIGLPGDFSSSSRFIRALFLKTYAVKNNCKSNDIFHVMDSLCVPKGAVLSDTGDDLYTIYTACYNCKDLSLSVCTYERRETKSYHLHGLEGSDKITSIPL